MCRLAEIGQKQIKTSRKTLSSMPFSIRLGLAALLRSNASESEIVEHLVDIETNGMGIERPRANSAETVELLLRWRVLVAR